MAADGPSTATPGTLIALEGLADDALDTQLQLLPTSSQILVLPSLQHYLDQDSDTDSDNEDALQNGPHSAAVSAVQPYSTPYDVRRYIRRVHAAANTRRDIALEFLRGSNDKSVNSRSKSKSKSRSRSTSRSDSSKRIVFLNGGTASGHALCIEAIRQRHTAANGNVDKAARLFSDLTSDGVAGLQGAPRINLRKATPSRMPDAVTSVPAASSNSKINNTSNGITCTNCNLDPTDDSDDPITKAMRAADALDRETETLQPNTNTIDLTTDGGTTRRMRPRSMSLPVHGELLDLMEFSRRISHASKASASANSAISTAMTASTATYDRASSIWVRPSVAAGASGSEVYDISNFNFMSPSFAHAMGTPSIPPANSTTHLHSHSQTRFSMTTQTSGTTHSPTRSPTRSPTSTIFPISMRLDAIAAQSQRATSVYFGQLPAPRGRTRFRPRNLASDASTQSLEDLVFPMPPRRAQSLERSGSQSSRSFASNFLLSNSRDTSLQRLSYLSDMTQSTTSAVAGPGPTSGPAIPLRKSSISYYDTASIPDFPVPGQNKTPAAPVHSTFTSQPYLKPKASSNKTITNRKWPTYVDRGTDAEQISVSDALPLQLQSPLPADDEVFEPVLPFTEDLVVYFDEGNSTANPALELAFERCRELYCSRVRRQRRSQKQQQLFKVQSGEELDQLGLKSHLELDRQTIASSLPETPRSASHGHAHTSSVSTTASSSIDDYDPFAPHEYDTSPRSRPHAPSLSSVKTAKPPTPAHTPPPTKEGDSSDSEGDEGHTQTSPHFHTLDASKRQTPLALQNALRSILALHFSKSASASEGDGEVDLSASPGRVLMSYLTGMESAELWTPLLDGVDLVLAIGSQRGVQPDLIAKIAGQLDQSLGSDGAARCDRLDVRYLMANAMQTLKKSNQKVEPKTLATLVVKQLDLYLKTSPVGAFCAFSSSPPPRTVLLDYPLELLAIVLGLRQLAGRDVVQVASVVVSSPGDDDVKVRPGFQKLRASPPPSLRPIPSSQSVSSLNSFKSFKSAATSASNSTFRQDSEKQPPYLRANYLLTSAATSSDIAAFVASVRKMPAPPSLSPMQPRETAGRYSALSTATTAANMSMSMSMGMQMQLGMNRSTSRNSNMSPMHSPAPVPPPPMPMSPVSARKPVPSHTRTASSTTTIRHTPQVQSQPQTTTRSKSPAPSVKSEISHISQASQSSSIVSQPDSWRSTTGSNYKNAATGLAPAPVVLPSSRLVAKTIQVGRRREEPQAQAQTQAQTQVQNVQAQAQRQPSPQPSIRSMRQPMRQPSPQPSIRRQSPQPQSQPMVQSRSQSQAQDRGRGTPDIQYNDDDYDFDDLDDDDLDNDMDMRRLMPLYMRDRTVLLKAKEAAGLRNMRVPSARNKSGRLTGMSNYSSISNGGSGVVPRRSVVEYQSQSPTLSQGPPQSQAAQNRSQSPHQSHQLDLERGMLQPRGSMNSMRSQVSHASLGQNNEGKKALKWLGLA